MTLLGRRLSGKLSLLPTFAAAMAFYFLVSLVPFLVVVSRGLAWLFSANLTPELAGFLRDIMPPETRLRPDALVAAVASRRGLGFASTVVGVWTASSGLNEMARAVHYLFSDPDRPDTGGFRRRLKAFGLLIVWAAAMSAAAVAFVLLPLAEGRAASAGLRAPGALGTAFRYPTAAGLLLAAFWSTYYFVPEHRPSPASAAQGAALATAVWSGVSLLFAFLLPRVWHVSLYTGAMSSALALLSWAYCGAWGVLAGAAWAARADE